MTVPQGWISWNWSYRILLLAICVVGIVSKSSVRTPSTLNQCAISRTPFKLFENKLFSDFLGDNRPEEI